MNVTKKPSKTVPCPEGSHVAIVAQIIDNGMQPGKNGPWRMYEVMLETPDERHTFNEERGEEPFLVPVVVSDNIGGTKKPTKLRTLIEGITGKALIEKEFDLEQLLGIVCQIQVIHEVKGEYTNAVVKSFMPMPKTFKKKLVAESPTGVLDLNNFDADFFAMLPEWKQEKIKKTAEYQALAPQRPAPKAPPIKGGGKKKDLFN